VVGRRQALSSPKPFLLRNASALSKKTDKEVFMKSTFTLIVSIAMMVVCVTAVHGGNYALTEQSHPDANNIAAYGINDAGIRVGEYSSRGSVAHHGFFGEGGSGSSWKTLDYPDAESTCIYDINNKGKGEMVGYYDRDGRHGFFYDGATWKTLDYPGASQTIPHGNNDVGHIVGYYRTSVLNFHGFLHDGAAWKTLDYPGAESTWVYGINNKGQMVGEFDKHQGLLYSGSKWTHLSKPGAVETICYGINDAGVIVGWYRENDSDQWGHGFVYDGTTWTTLDFPGSYSAYFYDINSAGWATGAKNFGITTRAVLAVP
jgi:hypothetical protein